jgi:hypothetical protein
MGVAEGQATTGGVNAARPRDKSASGILALVAEPLVCLTNFGPIGTLITKRAEKIEQVP